MTEPTSPYITQKRLVATSLTQPKQCGSWSQEPGGTQGSETPPHHLKILPSRESTASVSDFLTSVNISLPLNQ
jgi:hypothetical protein